MRNVIIAKTHSNQRTVAKYMRPDYFPKGLNTIINRGNNVNAVISAINIARPVRRPKRIVGIKYDKTKIENPAIIVREV